MYFTPAIDKYFAYWILKDTWYTSQDIEDNFYRFVLSLHYFSRSSKNGDRNPRTYNKQNLIEKILLAVKRNHESFDEKYSVRGILGPGNTRAREY